MLVSVSLRVTPSRVLPPSSVATRLRAVVQVRKRAGCAPPYRGERNHQGLGNAFVFLDTTRSRLHPALGPNRTPVCLLFIHPGAPNLISLRSAGTIPA